MAIKMTKLHYEEWTKFRESDKNTLTKDEQELLGRLHAYYFKHSYYLPCTCNPKTYNAWIDQLNTIYDSQV